MKIRHVLPNDGWMAAYMLTHEPWIEVRPLLFWNLVVRDGEDALVGMIVDGVPVCAEDWVNENRIFYGYYLPSQFYYDTTTDPPYNGLREYLQNVINTAYELYGGAEEKEELDEDLTASR